VLYGRDGVRRSAGRGQDKGHRAEVAAFSRAVADGGQVEALPFDACVHSTLATFAIVEALRTGQPVEMSEFEASVLGAR
jgi:predicted dehydrogenase